MLFQKRGLAAAEAFPQCLKKSGARPPSPVGTACVGIFCMHALPSCSEFLFLDMAKPSFPSVLPPARFFFLNVKITLSNLRFFKAIPMRCVRLEGGFFVPVPLHWYVGCGFDCLALLCVRNRGSSPSIILAAAGNW